MISEDSQFFWKTDAPLRAADAFLPETVGLT